MYFYRFGSFIINSDTSLVSKSNLVVLYDDHLNVNIIS